MARDRVSCAPLRDCSSIAIFRALQLGDLLCAVPALRALRRGLPHARITLVGLPWARAFASRFRHYLDDFVAFPGAPPLPEQTPDVARLPAFFADMRARRFDLAVQMHGNGVHTNGIVARFGASCVAGFHVADTPVPDPRCYLPYPAHLHEIRRNLRLVELLGVAARGETLEFPLTQRDRDDLATVPELPRFVPGSYACLHPGARNPAKRWPVERFARVGDTLHASGFDIVLTGSAAERPIADAVAQAMQAPSVNLASPISIGSIVPVHESAWLPGCDAPTGRADADWQWPDYAFAVDRDWPSGVYVAQLLADNEMPLDTPDLAATHAAALFRRPRRPARQHSLQASARDLSRVQLHRRRLLLLRAVAIARPAGKPRHAASPGWRHRR
jgi:ADP-heptose:LPS heptosyltransferase